MISFLSLVQKMSCNFQGKTQTLEIRCKKVSSKAKLNEKKTKFTELRSKVLLCKFEPTTKKNDKPQIDDIKWLLM